MKRLLMDFQWEVGTEIDQYSKIILELVEWLLISFMDRLILSVIAGLSVAISPWVEIERKGGKYVGLGFELNLKSDLNLLIINHFRTTITITTIIFKETS